MKIIKSQENIVVDSTKYQCDKCEFTSSYERDVEEHYGEKHTFIREIEINGTKYLYFFNKR